MKKIKLIDLLNMKAKGEKLPKKIKIDDEIYELEKGAYYTNLPPLGEISYYSGLFDDLNKEVEILEDIDILDEKEKEYLSAVIRPFRNRVEYIEKASCDAEYIFINLGDDGIALPFFEKGTMYKGMELAKEYTLEELGL